MSVNREVRKPKAKTTILGELDRLAEDRHPRNKTLLARFARCQDLQRSALTIARAMCEGRKVETRTEPPSLNRQAALSPSGLVSVTTPWRIAFVGTDDVGWTAASMTGCSITSLGKVVK